MILDNSTILYVYPRRKLADGYYEAYGEICGCRSANIISELKYKIRKCRLDHFVRICSSQGTNYDDFHIGTDFSSLREHVSKKELSQKAATLFIEKMSNLCEMDLRRVISSIESGYFDKAIIPPVLNLNTAKNMSATTQESHIIASDYDSSCLINLPASSSETASASDKLYNWPKNVL